MATFSNVYQNHNIHEPILIDYQGQAVQLRGKWQAEHFQNNNPITLELACGGGEYTLALARRYPERNFIGVDIKGARLWKGARVALAEELHNAAFLRIRIEMITHFFAKDEIAEIWITFPDPFPRKGKANRRLTATPFLKRYQQILQPNGLIHLKTDDLNLYEFTLETITEQRHPIEDQCADIYADNLPLEELAIRTFYEKMHLADERTIKYVRFQLKAS